MSEEPIAVRPSRSARRTLVVPLSLGGYFDRGGFFVTAASVAVVTRFGRRVTVPRAAISAVVLAHLPRFDSRLLLVNDAGMILAQDQATFYDDEAVARLAEAIGVPLRTEHLPSYADVERAHADVFRYRWMFRPYRTGVLLAVVITAVTVFVVAATSR